MSLSRYNQTRERRAAQWSNISRQDRELWYPLCVLIGSLLGIAAFFTLCYAPKATVRKDVVTPRPAHISTPEPSITVGDITVGDNSTVNINLYPDSCN